MIMISKKSLLLIISKELHILINDFNILYKDIDFLNFTNSQIIKKSLEEIQNMILDGEAGIGKSHLLADIVNNRIEKGYSSIFLLGQHFREDKNPWNQILDLLDLRCCKDEFLDALNTNNTFIKS